MRAVAAQSGVPGAGCVESEVKVAATCASRAAAVVGAADTVTKKAAVLASAKSARSRGRRSSSGVQSSTDASSAKSLADMTAAGCRSWLHQLPAKPCVRAGARGAL